MPYTLMMGLLWFVLALVLGVVVGWVLRSVIATRQVAAARARSRDDAELVRLRTRVRELEVAAEGSPSDAPASPATDAPASARDEAGLDVAAARPVLGHAIERDDLKVIVGIGANIEELCHGIGIVTWADLADTEVSLLRTMLADAGSRFQVHDPTSWPEQARMLAEGRWDDFARFRDAATQGAVE